MDNQKHKKHPPANRLKAKKYHRNEFGIYGTTCTEINKFTTFLRTELSIFKSVIVDADHNVENHHTSIQIAEKKLHYSQSEGLYDQDKKLLVDSADIVFVNGNHYPATNQIIIINKDKEASLKRRIDQLDSVFAVIIEDNEDEIFPFLKDKLNDSTLILRKNEQCKLLSAIREKIEIPELKALILAGGKSMRMGFDKTEIAYNGKSQALHIKDLCEEIGLKTYISKDHKYQGDNTNIIKDRMVEMGPLGGIISAFMLDRNCAWLVIASDMPFVNKTSIEELINKRNNSEFATTYVLSEDSFPEPTFTIYEPRIYKRILDFLSLGYTCPRKVLINSDVQEVIVSDTNILRNINTPEEKDQAMNDIKTS